MSFAAREESIVHEDLLITWLKPDWEAEYEEENRAELDEG